MLTFLEGLLPGSRHLRPPLIAGLLWGIFLWLLLGSRIPDRDNGSGLTHEFVRFTDFVGPVPTLIIGAVLIYVVGSVATSVVGLITPVAAWAVEHVDQAWRWQFFAQQKRRQLRMLRADLTAQAEALTGEQEDAQREDDSERGIALQRRRRSAARTNVEGRLAGVTETLRTVDPRAGAKFWKKFLPRTEANRKALGDPPARTDTRFESRLVERVWRSAVLDQLGEQNVAATLDGIEDADASGEVREAVDALQAELAFDPLDVLRSLDEKHFLELDRERSEREVRLAIAVPLFAISIQCWSQHSSWFSLVTVISLVMLVRSLSNAARERYRVLSLISVAGMQTPAIRAAAASGRVAVLRFTRRQQEAQRENGRDAAAPGELGPPS